MRVRVLCIVFLAVCFSNAAEIRIWTLSDGTSFEAKYVSILFDKVVMEGRNGKQTKIEMARFTAADIEFFELENPPEFKINFKYKTKQFNYSDRFINRDLPVVLLYRFGVQIKKSGVREYNHPVKVEYFAIASQRGANEKFILVDRGESSFIPSRKNDYTHEFWSSRDVAFDKYSLREMRVRGKEYKGYLVLVKDKNGKLIGCKYSNRWLLDNLENLNKLSVGNFMDETCTRVYPRQPTESETLRRKSYY